MRFYYFLNHESLFSSIFKYLLPLCMKIVMIKFDPINFSVDQLIAKVFVSIIDTKWSWIGDKFLVFWLAKLIIWFGLEVIMIFIILKDMFAFDKKKIGLGEIDLICLVIGVFLLVHGMLRSHIILSYI